MRADLALRRRKPALKLNAKGPDTPTRGLRQYLGACALVLNPAEGRGRRHATHTLGRLARCVAAVRRAAPDVVKLERNTLRLAFLGVPTRVGTAVEHLFLAVLFAGGGADLGRVSYVSASAPTQLRRRALTSPPCAAVRIQCVSLI